jgi:hypothetical protein
MANCLLSTVKWCVYICRSFGQLSAFLLSCQPKHVALFDQTSELTPLYFVFDNDAIQMVLG